ncbi:MULTISPECIES: hypothetical protein [unclassified Streptomyces]|uniref:hypothetical protein n=1 Tax=unclassified Streptomyces TaxID=2593676 RepID=UPI002DD81AA1|nr:MULTISPECIES: hypothetical protein [unclassified Streptomyces]WSA95246.1 hypothetical protein OIE63_29575 [Streptomyces sp. NBC_01795]WSB79664.1 hypothetical protein OHB04_30685 [Streptomyces sp. NBC_01775]WSS12133.1 hypothetical protein OG533_09530 [Streptomyces sp. NBC_01186]WSS40844.1 hypothetical protein OG220_09685 [Streptomyces sp. NBC_01187]
MRKTATSASEPESMEQLRGDCARMAPHWTAQRAPRDDGRPVPPQVLHGVSVPSRSARLLDGMSEYGD